MLGFKFYNRMYDNVVDCDNVRSVDGLYNIFVMSSYRIRVGLMG